MPCKKNSDAKKSKDEQKNKENDKRTAGEKRFGYDLVETDEVYPDPLPYDRRDPFYRILSDSEDDFLRQIPIGDPYRQFDLSKTDGGVDLRWLFLKGLAHTDEDQEKENEEFRHFLMNINFSMRYRPFYRYLHFVYENQILGRPSENPKYSEVLDVAATRSLYVMVDNLPYNIFAQAGLYRPLFGQYVPDHTQLSQRMFAWATTGSTRSQALVFQAATVGTAPNVPFANIHYIGGAKQSGSGVALDKTKGFAANGGLRFVSYGGNVNYSYWNTETQKENGDSTKLQMHGFGVMGTFFDRYTQGIDFVTFERDDLPVDYRTGAVITSESYYRFHKEHYVTMHYGYANTTFDLLPGEGHQLKLGLRSFLLPGLEVSSTIDRDIQKAPEGGRGNSVSSTTWTTQMHLYL